MTTRSRRTCVAITFIGLGLASSRLPMLGAQQRDGGGVQPPAARSRLALTHALPPLNGQRLEVRVVEVTYPPGSVSAAHRHPCPVIGYVIEGAVRMQVSGRPETVYRAGETFHEGPDDVHVLGANASDTEPARFIAYFTCDGPGPLTVPVPVPERR
jgi:quercetin dioxygenase-like cupin family protein